MQFVYALVNFLILAGILFLFGRKTIASIFETRREKINKALDEAEAAEKITVTLPVIPTVEELCGEIERDNEVAEIEQEAALEVHHKMRQTDEIVDGMRREAVSTAKDDFIRKLTERCESHPSLYRMVAEDQFGGYTFCFPKSLLTINPRAPMSADLREKHRRNAIENGLGKNRKKN